MNAIAAEFQPPALPQDVELEQAVIGICIVWNEHIPAVESVCAPDDFFHVPHARIVEAIFTLHREGKPVSPLSIRAALGDYPALMEMGGHLYLATLAQGAPVDNPIPLARIIAELGQRRDALLALMQSQEAITNRTIPIVVALEPAQQAADYAAQKSSEAADGSTLDTSNEILRDLQNAMDGKPIPKITTGLVEMDKILGGLQAGDFAIIAGRPGMLKTGLLAGVGLAASAAGAPVLFFELEMTRKQLQTRMACTLDYQAHPDDPMAFEWFRRGDIRDFQLERLAHALWRIPKSLRIFDRSGVTIHEIAALARGYAKREKRMGLVIIDYLQLVKAGERYKGNAVQEITEISKAVKVLAKSIGWPVLVACQLSRGVESREDKRPQLQDLRESGQLEQDADQVIGLYREGYYVKQREPDRMDPRWHDWAAEMAAAEGRMELLVRKNRHGRAEKIDVICELRSGAILDGRP